MLNGWYLPNCFYSAISVRLAGSNSLIHLGDGKGLSYDAVCVSAWTSSVGLWDSENNINHSKGLDRFSCKRMSLKVYAKIRFGHFWFVLALSTIVLAGNDPFSTKNITQNRKRFITQPKPIKYKDDDLLLLFIPKNCFSVWVWPMLTPFLRKLGPKIAIFRGFISFFFRTTGY